MKEIVFSCEHAENSIPPEYKNKIIIPLKIINSHRGFDQGAKNVCENLARQFNAFYITGNVSRLVVDLNRSVFHKNIFSEYLKGSMSDEKNNILRNYYYPYRVKLEEYIANVIHKKKRSVIHLSIHSFTPELNGETRNADFGILYNPKRMDEKIFADNFKTALENISRMKIRMNYPYKGISDGITTSLRKKFDRNRYAGIEIEINQKLLKNEDAVSKVSLWLIEVLKKALKKQIDLG
jgi:predicted N-formylglutamate amidohydrolase